MAESYLEKARKRLKVLDVLMREVELSLKGLLRYVGIEPPKLHDVGSLVLEHKERFPTEISERVEQLAAISKWLRKEREFAFYGDVDFIPTVEYTEDDAERARTDAEFVVVTALKILNDEVTE